LKQIVDFDVRVTVVTIFHFTAFAEKRIRFIKKQNGAATFGCVE
jgi:hypothetical protein